MLEIELVAVPFSRYAVAMRRWIPLVVVVSLAGCSRDPGLFVEANARAHIGMLAGTIGSRPVGTPENRRAREYVIDQLRQIGLEVRVQEVDARRHEIGRAARVANIIALLPGERSEAVGLVTHYDSSPDAPGATDAGLGVGIAIEAARVFATTGRRYWSLYVIVTDGEESGLMGAAALVNDRHLMDRLRAYINLESIGSSGTPFLFETGPANAWIVSAWARHAPHPRGGSHAIEIYNRLPNDTDFSIFKTRGVPGLNFAPIGDSYAYHTARDTPERLSRQTIIRGGENAAAIVAALQSVDITRRRDGSATFFDVSESVGVSYRPAVQVVLSAASLGLGVVACVRFVADAIRQNGMFRWLLALVWTWTGAAISSGAMVAATWLLRSAREVYHPWYARPGRTFLLLILIGITAGWGMSRLGRWLPRSVHPSRHPSLTWSVTLPSWLLLATVVLWYAPAASYLFTVPLLTAGIVLAPVGPRGDVLVRIGSFAVLTVSATLWVPDTRDLLRFLVAVMGRLSTITPVFVYAALLAASGIMLIPPLVATFAWSRPLTRPWLVTSLLLFANVAAATATYMAPAYTAEQPLRRHVRAVQELEAPTATWEVASLEPGLDLHPNAPGGWRPFDRMTAERPGRRQPEPKESFAGPDPFLLSGQSPFPFVFQTTGPALGPPPATIAGLTLTPLAEGIELSLSIVPTEPGLTVSFVLPPGLVPARTSLPGVHRLGRWSASFVAPPPEGIRWQASFGRSATEQQLRDTRVIVTSARFPGGSGWQQLPDWLPQENTVWSGTASWVVAAATAPSIAPVPALR